MLLVATLLLTLSNVAFLPSVVLALHRRFYTEAFVYAATMCFSTVRFFKILLLLTDLNCQAII